ncbi:unnamed protein product [Aphanomyces euteiches]|uniref:RNase III domain-containing protein n=1 Tax=Aphanomyces euteiches TaxID=100861 RepID=A0A6G0WE06_9STRA|nr:hypothetical protein Ae201684_015910 [Aphanomyces euteiches]KAH9154852.1 hypothetical protein AeRB84_003111 [Aphanomyces euteiches]
MARDRRKRRVKTGAKRSSLHGKKAPRFQVKRVINPQKKEADEVLEWLGDAVLDELVGRALLRHVQIFCANGQDGPVSNLDLFRQLRNSLVTNSNLCAVYDKLFPSRYTIQMHPLKIKQKADAVETMVGRMASRRRKTPEEIHQLDRVLATMMEVEFTHWAVEQEETAKQSFNQFSILESLIDTDEETIETPHTADPIVLPVLQAIPSSVHVYHAFPEYSPVESPCEPFVSQVHDWVQAFHVPTHVLRTSRDLFEIFKLYGMAVLKERVSSCLFQTMSGTQNPATLTVARQNILSIEGEAKCAEFLQIAESNLPTKLQANTLRAAVGFASATGHTDVVNIVSGLLVYLHERPCADCSVGVLNHHNASCIKSAAAYLATQWTILPEVTQLNNLPKSVVATIEFLRRRQLGLDMSAFPLEWLRDLQPVALPSSPRKRPPTNVKLEGNAPDAKINRTFTLLQRFAHRRFLFCLEAKLLVAFAKGETQVCKQYLTDHAADDLEPCLESLSGCGVSDHCLSLVFKDSFYRLLMHELVSFHALVSKSKTDPNGLRVMQIRRPVNYAWPQNIYTDEKTAIVD